MLEPKVTVFTPNYNCAKYISDTIQSVLNQSFVDFEYIIIDDASTDNSVNQIEKFNDSRISLIKNKENKGISWNRNQALKIAKGKYLVMLDSDDLAHKDRLKEQFDFLETNPSFGIVGTYVIPINELGSQILPVVKYKLPFDQIPCQMFFNNYIATSSIMLRMANLKGLFFNEGFIVAEDYELWIRVVRNCNIGHIRKPLTYYRHHCSNISIKRRQLMINAEKLLLKRQLDDIGINYSDEYFNFYYSISTNKYSFSLDKFDVAHNLLSLLLNANLESKLFNFSSFKEFLFKYWKEFFIKIKRYNITLLKIVLGTLFFKQLSKKEQLFFFIKCIINYNIK